MTNDQTVTQMDRDLAAEFLDWETWEEALKFNRRAHVIAEAIAFARHRIAHSGEGRSNGAGEDVERLVRIFRSLPLHGDAGCDKLTDDEWRQVALAALTDISLSAPQSEVERLREALDRIEATLDAAERTINASPFWDDNSRYAGKALLDYPRAQIAAERAALAQPEAGGER